MSSYYNEFSFPDSNYDAVDRPPPRLRLPHRYTDNVRYAFLQYSPTPLVDKTKWKILNAGHYQNFNNSNLKHSDKIILKDVKLQYTK